MKNVISNVFSCMYYLIPEEEETKNTSVGEDFLATYIEIFDVSPIVLCAFYFSPDLANTLCENLLGLEADELEKEDIESTLLETCNMLSGNFLREVADNTPWQLGIPSKALKENLQTFVETKRPVKGAVQFSNGRIVFEIFSRDEI
jgi:CheY-specific phosphatase CheX